MSVKSENSFLLLKTDFSPFLCTAVCLFHQNTGTHRQTLAAYELGLKDYCLEFSIIFRISSTTLCNFSSFILF